MKHALIVAHPNPDSFNLLMARVYEAAATAQGDSVVMRDLYRLGFDPRLAQSEIPGPEGFRPGDDVVAERDIIGDAQVFAFVYPLWLNTPPAMMKGYFERVFGMGFGYEHGKGGNQPLLRGRYMFSLSTSGAPETWLRQTGMWDAERKLFDEHFASVCGLTVAEHLHLGGIVPMMTQAAVDQCVDAVKAAVARNFAPSAG